MTPTFVGTLHPAQITAGSNTFLTNAREKGILSTQSDDKDFAIVEKSLNNMLAAVDINLKKINDIINEQTVS